MGRRQGAGIPQSIDNRNLAKITVDISPKQGVGFGMNSEKLKITRRAIKMTVLEMCEALGVSKRTYEKWEAGSNKMTGANHTAVNAIKYLYEIKMLDKFKEWRKYNA